MLGVSGIISGLISPGAWETLVGVPPELLALGSGGFPMQPLRNRAPVAEAAEVIKNLRRLNEVMIMIDFFYTKGADNKGLTGTNIGLITYESFVKLII
jgi:hypothetical protein